MLTIFINMLDTDEERYKLKAIYEIYYGTMLNVAKNITTDHALAEDAVSNPTFYLNAKMELFTGGAMLDFADSASDGYDTYSGGFNDVNNVVMSKRLNNSIEFYNAYMNKVSASNKVLMWRIFNQNNSAFDYTLPQVSISGNRTTGFTAQGTDDVVA